MAAPGYELPMRSKRPQYELPIAGSAWTRGAGHPAGIYFLEGRCHVAAWSSAAEQDLVARGALRIADLHFDPDPRETGRGSGPVRALRPHAAIGRFVAAGEN